MLARPPLHLPARARTLRGGLHPPPGGLAPKRHLSQRSTHLAPRSTSNAASCAGSPRSYQVLSRAAAQIHARAALGTVARPANAAASGWRSLFARLGADLRAVSRRGTGSALTARSTTLFVVLATKALQRAVGPRLGPIRLAVDAGVAKNLAKQVSPIFRGAAQAFTGLQLNGGRISNAAAFSQRINLSRQPIVSFARASARPGSGFGPRAPLVPRSPVYGAGLQTARNFSSGGRVFDNLIVNAPLALRLAGHEIDEKRKMARATSVPGPRRTDLYTTSKQREQQSVELGRRIAARFAPLVHLNKGKQAERSVDTATDIAAVDKAEVEACQKSDPVPAQLVSATSTASCAESVFSEEDDYAEMMLSYFDIPLWECHTRITIRRCEDISNMLGRRPQSPRPGHAVFDDRFLEDAQLGMEFEDRRWLKIQAILRAIYEDDPLRPLSISEDGDRYVVLVRGVRAVEVATLLRARLGFALDFVELEDLAMPDGLDLSRDSAVASQATGPSLGSVLLLDQQGRELYAPLEDLHGSADDDDRSGTGLGSWHLDGASELSLPVWTDSAALTLASPTLSSTTLESLSSDGPETHGEFLYDSRELPTRV